MKEKHVCKYKRLRYKSGNEVFFCTLPECNVKMNPALCLGKKCICWRCGNEFILNEYSLRLAKPHCSSCHKPKKGNEEFIDKDLVIIHPSLDNDVRFAHEPTLAERMQQTIQQAANSVNSENEEDEL